MARKKLNTKTITKPPAGSRNPKLDQKSISEVLTNEWQKTWKIAKQCNRDRGRVAKRLWIMVQVGNAEHQKNDDGFDEWRKPCSS